MGFAWHCGCVAMQTESAFVACVFNRNTCPPCLCEACVADVFTATPFFCCCSLLLLRLHSKSKMTRYKHLFKHNKHMARQVKLEAVVADNFKMVSRLVSALVRTAPRRATTGFRCSSITHESLIVAESVCVICARCGRTCLVLSWP